MEKKVNIVILTEEEYKQWKNLCIKVSFSTPTFLLGVAVFSLGLVIGMLLMWALL